MRRPWQEPPAEQQKFFLHRDPILFLLRGEDMTLQQNYELHQKLTDERHWSIGWERHAALRQAWARACSRDLLLGGAGEGTAGWRADQAYCFQDCIVQRMPSGELGFVACINTDHSFLPGSATVEF